MEKKETREIISYEDFEKVELRSGTVVRVEAFPRARRPSFKVWVDFGPEIGVLQTSAQVTVHYTLESLLGRHVMGCINLGEKNIAGFLSQFLLVGFADPNGAIYLTRVLDNQKVIMTSSKTRRLYDLSLIQSCLSLPASNAI